MATSGIYGFTPELADNIEDAFERIQVMPAAITGEHIKSAIRSIELMFDAWSNLGDKLPWTTDITTAALVAGVATITLAGSTGVNDVLVGFLRRDNVDVEMVRISEEDYLKIPNKTIQGRPSQFYVHRQQDQIVVNFWQVPENSTDLFVYRRLRLIQSPGAMSNNPDLRSGWKEAFTQGLAAKLAHKWNRPVFSQEQNLANAAFNLALRGGRDRSALQFQVNIPGC